jgi:hypothetical protein
VSATAPDENPRISRNNPSVPIPAASILSSRRNLATSRGSKFLVTSVNEMFANGCIPNRRNSCARPQPTNPVSTKMYRYVGTAKIRPDSLIPRRFATVIRPMAARHSRTRWFVRACRAGIDVIARTPALTDTATVRM